MFGRKKEAMAERTTAPDGELAWRLSDRLLVSDDEQRWWNASTKMWEAVLEGTGIARQVQRELHGAGLSVPETQQAKKTFMDRMHAANERQRTEQEQRRFGEQLVVRTYKNAEEYERDARVMIAHGYAVQGQSQGRGKVNMGRTMLKAGLFLPWAVMRPSRKGDPITVTWIRS